VTAASLILIGLSASLTVASAIALLLRRTAVGRRGAVMNAVWAAVLLLAILPLPLPADFLPYHLFGDERSDALIHIAADTPEQQAVTVEQFLITDTPSTPTETAPVPMAPAETPHDTPSPIPFVLAAFYVSGAAVTFLYFLRRSASSASSLRACSRPCTDGEILARFHALLPACGLRRTPELRILDEGISCSPCTTGILSPCIYLPAGLSREDIPSVLAHELCHIKRRDALRRLRTVAVVSVHRFNPAAHFILPLIHEDMEQSCDSASLRLLGGTTARPAYMRALLRVACMACPPQFAALHFFTRKSPGNAIKRRFLNMKHPTRRLSAVLISLVLILALLMGSTVTFTACGILGRGAPEDNLTPLTEFILRYYHNLGPEEEITREMCEAITSLELSVMLYDAYPQAIEEALNYPSGSWREKYGVEEFIDALEKKTLLDFKVNTHDAPEGSYEALTADCRYWTDMIPENVFADILYRLKENDKWNYYKYQSFYQLLDFNLEDEAHKQKMLTEFPGIQKQPTYMVESTLSVYDALFLHTMIHQVGVYDPLLIDGNAIDTDAIRAAFPNLEHLDLVGLRAAE